MVRKIRLLQALLVFTAAAATANENTSQQPFTLDMARACIQLNKDLSLASEQMLETEQQKHHLASKVNYLEGVIDERRQLINRLDQRNSQENNENYNQLVTQFEDLSDERRDTIGQYNQKHELHLIQHESVVRLEQRFSSECLYGIVLTEDIYAEACQVETIRWCSAFNFN